MKTKKIYISLIAVLSLLAVSCTDYLDEDNKTGYTEDIVYSTKTGLDGLVSSCYSYARTWYGKEAAFGLSEGGTDIWLTGYDNRQKILIDYSNITPEVVGSAQKETMNPCFDEYWEMFYTAINTCNTAIEWVGKASENILSVDNKSAYLGEAKFLRAFYYWHLVETWGPVQINKEPVSNASTEAVRNSEQEVYEFMLQDLDDAITLLQKQTAKNGRANLWTAKAFKARVLLYKGSRFNDAQAYTQAAQLADEVIAGSGTSFYANAADCWIGANEDGMKNKEVIWYVDYSTVLANNILPKRLRVDEKGDQMNWSQMMMREKPADNKIGGNASHLMFVGVWNLIDGLTTALKRTDTEANKNTTINGVAYNLGTDYQAYSKGFTRYVPSGYLLDLYNDKTDQRYQASFRDVYYLASSLKQAIQGGTLTIAKYPQMKDTAIYLSKTTLPAQKVNWAKNRYCIFDRTGTNGAYPLYTNESAISPTIATGTTTNDNYKGNRMYIQLKKFDDYTGSVIRDLGSKDAFVIRLAEMYLVAAEAYMMSGNSGNATARLNSLRTARAITGQNNALTTAETSQVSSKDINVILDERARELCGEQQRWFDLKRTGKLLERVKKYNQSAGANIKDFHVLRPIPQPQMDAVTNKETFKQNTGYGN